MWLFTRYGFYSAVCARQGDGDHGQPVNPDRITVRARMRQHLEALRGGFQDLLGECEIMESSSTDYAFRIFVPKSTWAQVMAELTQDMDYDNFKSKAASQQGSVGAEYVHSLHEVWSVMNKLQK